VKISFILVKRYYTKHGLFYIIILPGLLRVGKNMNIFKKKGTAGAGGVSAGLPKMGDALPASLKAHSQFIKRVSCSQCGAPKSLPSTTAYIYCDFCGSLMDYDFRIANADTNAGLTNTVFHRLIAGVQAPMEQAKAQGDREGYRALYRQVFSQWIQECPMAVSPRAKSEAGFREQLVAYMAECAVTKDLDPRQAPLDARMAQLVASLTRVPTPGGAWMVYGGFWEYAELFKQQMEMTYALIHEKEVDAMDPDNAPPGVALRMEYSTFCQGWLPHLSPADGDRLLKFYKLDAEYDDVQPQQTDLHKCGGCGAELHTLAGAQKVVCETCGNTIDISSGAVACGKCGAELSLPVSVNHVLCPYCNTDTRRV
jgi:LSD1 subclass zinc finger protein